MIDPTTTAAAVIARDDWRVRWLVGLTLVLWLLVAVATGTILVLFNQAVEPKARAMQEWEARLHVPGVKLDPAAREELERKLYGNAAIFAVALSYGLALLAAAVTVLSLAVLSTLWLHMLLRRATLRQIQASLAAIAGQLAEVQRGRGTMPPTAGG